LNRNKLIATFFSLAAALIFVIFKIAKYELCYYTDDLFSCLQLTRSWIDGYPLLWENRFGNSAALHNNYVSVLLAPFTVLAGSKGLFVAHALILFLSLVSFILMKDEFINSNFRFCFAVVLIIAAGPFSFWIFDNPHFGWFPDLLFLPFSLLFAVALISGKQWMIAIAAVLLVITKEDGPVIACCISIYFILTSFQRKQRSIILIKKLLITTGVWLLIFSFSIFLLFFQNDFKPVNLNIALNIFLSATAANLLSYFINVLSGFTIMMLPVVLLFFSVFKTQYLLFALAAALPIVIVGLISGFPHLPNTNYSLTWTARFTEVLGFFLAASVLSMTREGTRPEVLRIAGRFPALGAAVIIFMYGQFLCLINVKGYNIKDELLAVSHGDLPAGVTQKAIEMMKCIAVNTPRNTVVIPPENYYNIFEKHRYAWLDRIDHDPATPDLIITGDLNKLKGTGIVQDKYHTGKMASFYILTNESSHLRYKTCNPDDNLQPDIYNPNHK